MAHARQTIRERVAAIVTGLTTTSTRVYQSAVYNVQESQLPCLLVYTRSEEITEANTIAAPRQINRELELVVEGKAQATSNLDDLLDTIGAEVEAAVSNDPTLNINVMDTMLADVSIDYSVEGDKPIGSIAMRYRILYRTAENNPTSII